MIRKLAITMALAASVSLPLASIAEAAVADSVVGSHISNIQILPTEKAQFLFGGRNYCWYPIGWHGPGWYWCGYASRSGFGWGGGAGWNGWSRGGRGPRMGHGGMGGHGGGHGGHRGGHGGGHGGGGHKH